MSRTSETAQALRRLGWEQTHYWQAQEEGWRLMFVGWRLYVACHTHVPGHVSRFRNRKEAEEHVRKKSQEGSRLHQHAMAIVAKHRLLK